MAQAHNDLYLFSQHRLQDIQQLACGHTLAVVGGVLRKGVADQQQLKGTVFQRLGVPCSSYRLLCFQNFSAGFAVGTLRQSGPLRSGQDCCVNDFHMSQRCHSVPDLRDVTTNTGVGGIAFLCTGRRCHHGLIMMDTCCIHESIRVCVAAGTGIGGIALLGAGGGDDGGGVGMGMQAGSTQLVAEGSQPVIQGVFLAHEGIAVGIQCAVADALIVAGSSIVAVIQVSIEAGSGAVVPDVAGTLGVLAAIVNVSRLDLGQCGGVVRQGQQDLIAGDLHSLGGKVLSIQRQVEAIAVIGVGRILYCVGVNAQTVFRAADTDTNGVVGGAFQRSGQHRPGLFPLHQSGINISGDILAQPAVAVYGKVMAAGVVRGEVRRLNKDHVLVLLRKLDLRHINRAVLSTDIGAADLIDDKQGLFCLAVGFHHLALHVFLQTAHIFLVLFLIAAGTIARPSGIFGVAQFRIGILVRFALEVHDHRTADRLPSLLRIFCQSRNRALEHFVASRRKAIVGVPLLFFDLGLPLAGHQLGNGPSAAAVGAQHKVGIIACVRQHLRQRITGRNDGMLVTGSCQGGKGRSVDAVGNTAVDIHPIHCGIRIHRRVGTYREALTVADDMGKVRIQAGPFGRHRIFRTVRYIRIGRAADGAGFAGIAVGMVFPNLDILQSHIRQ